jgi:phenylalanine-4-hydroxylase
MATKLYTIESLLIGKHYRSRNRFFSGEIISAEKREGIWYGENTEAYVIGVNAKNSIRTQYATVAVKVGE